MGSTTLRRDPVLYSGPGAEQPVVPRVIVVDAISERNFCVRRFFVFREDVVLRR